MSWDLEVGKGFCAVSVQPRPLQKHDFQPLHSGGRELSRTEGDPDFMPYPKYMKEPKLQEIIEESIGSNLSISLCIFLM